MAHQMDLDTVAAYWNGRAAEFDSEHDTEELALWSRTLEQAIGLNGDGAVLDVGTGTGFLVLLLAKLGYAAVGVDIAADMLAQGVEKAKCFGLNVDFREAACERLPFADETFDAVVNCRVMWTLTAPEEAVREWKRVLKPGGKVISFMRMMDMTGGDFYGGIDLPLTVGTREAYCEVYDAAGLKRITVTELPEAMSSQEPHWTMFVGTKP